MSSPNDKAAAFNPLVVQRWGLCVTSAMFGGLMLALSSCVGMTAGQALYWSGLFPREKIKAQHKIDGAALLILIDDPEDAVTWPQTMVRLGESVRSELLTRKAAKEILPPDTAVRLRGTTPDFDKRGAREIGQMAHADQVLWLEVRDFYAQDQVEQVGGSAKLTLTVKLINARDGLERDQIRIWPDRPDGELIDVELSAADVTRANTADAVSRALAEKTADRVAKLFYDHEADDFRSGK